MENSSFDNLPAPRRPGQGTPQARPTLIHGRRQPPARKRANWRHTASNLLLCLASLLLLLLGGPGILNYRSGCYDACITAFPAAMKVINSAEAQNIQRTGRYGNMNDLSRQNLIAPRLAAAESIDHPLDGYWLRLIPSNSRRPKGYFCVGLPTMGEGTQMFYIDETGLIWSAAASTPVPIRNAHGKTPGTNWTVVAS